MLAPAAALFHLLDAVGELDDATRREGGSLIAVLAELLARRDFYPHHVATIPLGSPGSVQAIYRGMLNQNFNTDRYAFVGLAGCVLPGHPHAAAWRRHAVEQFGCQMTAYVYPGGAWEESHTYATHVQICLLPLVLALRYAPDGIDLMADGRFREACRFFVTVLSPRDPLLDGWRGIPAIGDHGYLHHERGFLFGWLASLDTAERERYLWAWHEAGSQRTDPRSALTAVFSPLLLPEPTEATGTPAPEFAPLTLLPGYGAVARHAPGKREESLLVVRCGDAWGHYHPDEGSFWWWSRGQLICADADLGGGPLKFLHRGHNVLGFPGREPMQHLGRTPYRITRWEQQGKGRVLLRCHIPVDKWNVGPQRDEPIPAARQPVVVRTFLWQAPQALDILDEPERSPDGKVLWTVHVVADRPLRRKGRTLTVPLSSGAVLTIALPMDPLAVESERSGATLRVSCVYPECALRHELRVTRTAGAH